MQNFITRPRKTIAAKIFILFVVCTLMACSASRLTYRHGEFLSYLWLNSYVNFEDDQTPWVKERIDNLFAWHRKTQLTDYAQLLAFHQKRLLPPVTQDELLADFNDVDKRLRVIAERALPDLADLALSLRPQQITYLEKKFVANNAIFRKENLRGNLEQRQAFRYKKAMQYAEYWFGNFSRTQEAAIRSASDSRPINNELLLMDRQQRQKELIALLRKVQATKPGRDATIVMLRDYLNRSYFDRVGLPSDQKAFVDGSRVGNAHLTMVIFNIANVKQKAHAIEKAQQWIDDFNQLSK